MKKHFLFAMLGMAVLVSCKKYTTSDPPEQVVNEDALAPEGFTFSTSKTVSLDVRLLTNDNQPLSGILVSVYSKDAPGSALYAGYTDANGNLKTDLNIPARMDTLLIDPAYVGLIRNAVAVIKNNAVTATIGGTEGFSGDIASEQRVNGRMATAVYNNRTAGMLGTTVVSYFGAYDNDGRPTDRVASDVISSELLSYVNTSLPEAKAVPYYHQEYLSGTAETNLNIEKLADAWVTFVSEGAGYLNTLGFYTYPTDHPPQAVSDIDSIKVIVPNASLAGSGGAMKSGDKVYLGRFPAGVSIGFVLLQNAWSNTTHTVNANATKFFADDILNNEKTGFKRHVVLLFDAKHSLFLTGFEDVQRDNGSSDQDFNDLVFYTTSNPVEAISTKNVKPIDVPVDADGDGVSDVYDKFPTDPKRAFILHFPADDTWGTLAFEDLWPSTGDYDMNDLVIGYHYTNITNGKNQTVEMNGDYVIKSVGATLKNGFAVQLPVTYDKISSVTGQKLTSNYISTNSNGTEAGQTSAVIVPFDDPKALINTNSVFVNVYNGRTYVTSDTAHVKVSFASPIAATELGTAPYNPFIISGQRRGYEVHLPGNKPTSKADLKLFGTMKDNSSVAKNKYYLTADNWPWAIGFLENFEYPTETSKINSAYSNFVKWAKSGGTTNADWYTNKSGYRISSMIFKK